MLGGFRGGLDLFDPKIALLSAQKYPRNGRLCVLPAEKKTSRPHARTSGKLTVKILLGGSSIFSLLFGFEQEVRGNIRVIIGQPREGN
jgi:hypothetical protein